jgi:hypothetical protein
MIRRLLGKSTRAVFGVCFIALVQAALASHIGAPAGRHASAAPAPRHPLDVSAALLLRSTRIRA